MKYRVVRAEGKTSDPGGMVVTLELNQKSSENKALKKAVLLASVGLLALGAFLVGGDTEKLTAEATATKSVALQPAEILVVQKPVDSVDYLIAVPEDDPQEDEKITAALVAQGYFRDDVPLSYAEQDYLHTACEEFGVDYHLMLGLIERETTFRNVQGDGGNAYGFCQIWPRWWSGIMEEIGADDLNDPFDNFRTACAILSELTEQYGSVEDALTHYNTGHSGPSSYASSVLANAEKWRGHNGSGLH